MASVPHSHFFRGLIVLMFVGAAVLVGGYGLRLIIVAFDGLGSSEGNLILFGLGSVLLILSPFVCIFGAVYWISLSPNSGDKNN
jgi:hypothetical protein